MDIEHKKAGITGAKYLNPVARPLRMVVIKQMLVTHKRRADRRHPMILTETTGIVRTVRKMMGSNVDLKVNRRELSSPTIRTKFKGECVSRSN
jgi:hypothetical protein